MAAGRVNIGGMPMNYRVYTAAAAPSGAGRENDIVLVTETTPGDIQMNCLSAPVTRSDGTALVAGDVYIALLTTSVAAFNALKKNALYGFPGLCYQYSGSAWNSVYAYLHHSGAWVQISVQKIMLYKPGDECTALTSGYSIAAGNYGGSVTKNASSMVYSGAYVAGSHFGGGALLTNSLINFAAAKKASIRCSTYNNNAEVPLYLVISSTRSYNSGEIASALLSMNTANQIVSLNTQSIASSAYIGVKSGMGSSTCTSTATIYELWLEV